MSGRLILVRHGQASFDQDDYDHLSPLGYRQARALAVWWHRELPLPSECWTGGMRRQIETAAAWRHSLIADEATGSGWVGLSSDDAPQAGPILPALRCEPRLREFDHREIFYRHRPDLLDAQALSEWKAQAADDAFEFERTWRAAFARWLSGLHPGDYTESWPAFRSRCLEGLKAVVASSAPAAVTLVFTSSGPLTALLQTIEGLDDAALAAVQSGLANTGVTEIELAPRWRLLRRNACEHLAGQPGLHSLR